MKVTEAYQLIKGYAINRSTCGKLPEKELKASKVIESFFNSIKSVSSIDELNEVLNEQL